MAKSDSGITGASGGVPYDKRFYLNHQDASFRSAGIVIPLVLSLSPVKSAVDVGCGVGAWAAQLMNNGVAEVVGIDGAYVDPALLQIPLDHFQPHDLSQPIHLGRRFDLAVCLEVAEHLPEGRAGSFVEDLVSLASCILFSAALPGQGGTNHLNEQFPSYWAGLFARHNYGALDMIRPQIWNNSEVEWYYRQNIVLFAHRAHPLREMRPADAALDYVHPIAHERTRKALREALAPPTLGELLRFLPESIRRSVQCRWNRLFRPSGK
jgi:SAM-dependent methyltransferase